MHAHTHNRTHIHTTQHPQKWVICKGLKRPNKKRQKGVKEKNPDTTARTQLRVKGRPADVHICVAISSHKKSKTSEKNTEKTQSTDDVVNIPT